MSGSQIWLYIEKASNLPSPIEKGNLLVGFEGTSDGFQVASLPNEPPAATLDFYSENLITIPDSVRVISFKIGSLRAELVLNQFTFHEYFKKKLWFGEPDKSPVLHCRFEMTRTNAGKPTRIELPPVRLHLEYAAYTECDQIRGVLILNQNTREADGFLTLRAKAHEHADHWSRTPKGYAVTNHDQDLYSYIINDFKTTKNGLSVFPFLLSPGNGGFTHHNRHTQLAYTLKVKFDRGRLHRTREIKVPLNIWRDFSKMYMQVQEIHATWADPKKNENVTCLVTPDRPYVNQGQTMVLDIEIENHSRTKIKSAEFTLWESWSNTGYKEPKYKVLNSNLKAGGLPVRPGGKQHIRYPVNVPITVQPDSSGGYSSCRPVKLPFKRRGGLVAKLPFVVGAPRPDGLGPLRTVDQPRFVYGVVSKFEAQPQKKSHIKILPKFPDTTSVDGLYVSPLPDEFFPDSVPLVKEEAEHKPKIEPKRTLFISRTDLDLSEEEDSASEEKVAEAPLEWAEAAFEEMFDISQVATAADLQEIFDTDLAQPGMMNPALRTQLLKAAVKRMNEGAAQKK